MSPSDRVTEVTGESLSHMFTSLLSTLCFKNNIIKYVVVRSCIDSAFSFVGISLNLSMSLRHNV